MDGSDCRTVTTLEDSIQEIYEWKITDCAAKIHRPYLRHHFEDVCNQPRIERMCATQSCVVEDEVLDGTHHTKETKERKEDSTNENLRIVTQVLHVEEGVEREEKKSGGGGKEAAVLERMKTSIPVNDVESILSTYRKASLEKIAELEHLVNEKMRMMVGLTMIEEERKLVQVASILDRLTFGNCARSVDDVRGMESWSGTHPW